LGLKIYLADLISKWNIFLFEPSMTLYITLKVWLDAINTIIYSYFMFNE